MFIWLRGTLPRLRYDQFMRFGWKVLVPTALVWILVVATMRTVSQHAHLASGEAVVYVGIPLALILLALLLVGSRSANRSTRLATARASRTTIAMGTPTKTATWPLERPCSREAVRITATTRIQASAVGTRTFQPKRMNWS